MLCSVPMILQVYLCSLVVVCKWKISWNKPDYSDVAIEKCIGVRVFNPALGKSRICDFFLLWICLSLVRFSNSLVSIFGELLGPCFYRSALFYVISKYINNLSISDSPWTCWKINISWYFRVKNISVSLNIFFGVNRLYQFKVNRWNRSHWTFNDTEAKVDIFVAEATASPQVLGADPALEFWRAIDGRRQWICSDT